MSVRVPSLRTLADGRWFAKWSGKRRYFGRDESAARKAYARSLQAWAARQDGGDRARRDTPSRCGLVIDLANKFIHAEELERGRQLGDYYRKTLKRFLTHFGIVVADRITVRDVRAIKEEMLDQGYAPKTVNPDITAINVLFNWLGEHGLVPPVSFKGCKPIPLPPPPYQAMSVDEVHAFVHSVPSTIAAWLAVNYLALARPTEVIRFVCKEGDWVEPGIFRLARGKGDVVSKQPRRLVCSELCLKWYEKCKPVWSRLDSYSGAGAPSFAERRCSLCSQGLFRLFH